MEKSRIIRSIIFNPGLMIGGLLVSVFALVAAFAPLIAPPTGDSPYLIPRDGYDPTPRPPSSEHLLGTLSGQHDAFYGLVWGTRVAFKIGLSITLGRALIGVLLGLIAGYYGGLLDAILMRLTDAFMAVPIMAAALLMIAFVSNPQPAALTLVLFGWMQYARLMRGNVLVERSREYIQAAVCVGAPDRRILFRHLLPNITRGLFVLIASDVGAVVMWMMAFFFVGLTRSASGGLEADWGHILSNSRDWIIGTPSDAFKYWYTYLPPSLAIVLFSMGWNFIGDGLRDVLDPRLR